MHVIPVKFLKINFCIQNEIDTVEQPRRKKYKAAFKQAASDRRLYDRRNLKSLDKKVAICSTCLIDL